MGQNTCTHGISASRFRRGDSGTLLHR
jgi:hypothetical protein